MARWQGTEGVPRRLVGKRVMTKVDVMMPGCWVGGQASQGREGWGEQAEGRAGWGGVSRQAGRSRTQQCQSFAVTSLVCACLPACLLPRVPANMAPCLPLLPAQVLSRHTSMHFTET